MDPAVLQAREAAMEAKARLETHEAVCAERYKQLNESLVRGATRMGGIEDAIAKTRYVLYGVGLLLLLGSEKISVIDTIKGWLK